jgi:ATP-dependent Zn protease
MDAARDYKRGTACHEAGHAVVTHSFNVPVRTVRIEFTADDGWRGRMESDLIDHLHYLDQATICAAGRAAEDLFNCLSYDSAWYGDMFNIHALLEANGIPESERRMEPLMQRARTRLEPKRTEVFRLVDLLVEHGKIDGPQFLRLMGE